MEKLLLILKDAFNEQNLISAHWSNMRKKADCTKITLTPTIVKEEYLFQFEIIVNNKAHHTNVNLDDIEKFLNSQTTNFKQIQIFTTKKDYVCLINKKGEANIKSKPATKTLGTNLSHNNKKNYVLDTDSSSHFLTKLGLMDAKGNIKPSKYDKYKQINKYIEIIGNIVDTLNLPSYRIIDFGCGKSYLTFALYHYLTAIKKKDAHIVGLDLKKDVIEFCNNLSDELGYNNLNFQVGDIGQYTTDKEIDIVISLHACNTTTDMALSKAIDWHAKAILAVPCCHNECYTQIKNDVFSPILKHGILKEKLASHITDGLRGVLLESVGYKVNIIEFIDTEHTPKNTLIRAILDKPQPNEQSYNEYQQISEFLGLDLTLNKLITSKK
ncbi:MAG: SAM-dependent methyltransferase [Epulopiscium sp. Nele67-Bin004]|nr:MAG: SAM-dependent methyltransferase [Epulopiscium sp. Nele67-Bin004]